MAATDQVLVLVAMAAGLAFSAIGWAYRAGAARGIPTCFVAVGMGLVGVAWFGWRSFGVPDAPGPAAPLLVWGWGVVNGLAQGYCVYLYRAGIRRGPFAPLWCAGNLVFVTPALFSLLLLGERINTLQAVAMFAAGLCVVTAALGQESDKQPGGGAKGRNAWALYLAMLTAMMALTGLCGAALKHLAIVEWQGAPLNPRFTDCFMLGMYAALLAWVLTEAAMHRRGSVSRKRIVGFAVVAGAGSVTGMTLTGVFSRLPGGIGFAVIAVASVVAGSLITSFGFGERRTHAWWATVGLAVLAVLLFNLSNQG